jgi:capsular exopolysaccharide synthesis family protein
MQRDSTGLDLIGALRIVRQQAPVIALCVVLTTLATFVVSSRRTREYTATADVLFRNQQIAQQAAGLPVIPTSNNQPDQDTNLKLATLPRVASETATALGHGLTRSTVADSVTVSQLSDTNVASVSATWTSPSFGAALANAYARQIVADRQAADSSYYAHALRAVNLQFAGLTPAEQRGPEGADLKDRAASLETLSQLQSSAAQLTQVASPPASASSPKVLRDTVLGAILGLVLGLSLAFPLHRLDRRLREPSDLEEIYGVPVVGVVPESVALNRAHWTDGPRTPLPPAEAEIFGLLRAHIRYFNVDRELRVVVVVSAAPGDGKTTVARNLAIASATVGSRVLFVEADLRRPAAAKAFGIGGEPGVAEVLIGTESFDSALQRVEFAARNESSVGLDVLVAGGVLPPNPPQVIESQAMVSLLEEARDRYDLVVIDTPPLALLPDAFPLLRHADGVLIVSRLRRNRSDVAARFRTTLESANAPVIGVVANGFKRPRGSSDGYGYSYTYDYTQYRATAHDSEVSRNGSTADRAPANK